MSTGRMKDQKDFDLEQIVKVIDTALESDDQRIKDALRALLTITVLCTAERQHEAVMGPFARMIEDMRNLNKRLSDVESELDRIKWDNQKRRIEPFVPPYQPPNAPYGPIGYPSTGPWIGTNDPTKPKPMWGTNWSAGDDPNYKGPSASSNSAEDFLKDLEEKTNALRNS